MMSRLKRGWLIAVMLLAQDVMAVPQWAFRVSFADKAGAPSVSNASSFLSARALARRTAQQISITEADRPVSPDYIDSVMNLTTATMHSRSRWFNNCVILLDDSTKIGTLQSKPFVQKIEWLGYFPNGLHNMSAPPVNPANTPAINPANKGTGTPAYYGSSWAQTDMVHGDYLHDQGLYGTGQLIAVLDLGFSGTNTHAGFDSLRARNGIVDQYNYVAGSTNAYTQSSHGTASLSTMAGLIPNSYVGSAPRADYALYVVDDVTVTDAMYELDNVIAAMERADSIGADIITGSIGYNEFVQPVYFLFPKADLNGHTTSVAIAANMAVARGIFVSMSAGNEGGNSWNFLLTPGDADSVETIGSVNTARSGSGFSSPGPNSSGRVKPDVCLLGEPAYAFTGFNGIATSSGTSVATPQLAGWAACLRQFKPSVTPYALRTAINMSADKYSAPTPKLGYGIPDFRKVLEYVGVDHVPGNAGISISPNPFKDYVNMRLDLSQLATLHCSLVDVTGRSVVSKTYKLNAGNQSLDLAIPAGTPAGIYLLEMDIDGAVSTYKLRKF